MKIRGHGPREILHYNRIDPTLNHITSALSYMSLAGYNTDCTGPEHQKLGALEEDLGRPVRDWLADLDARDVEQVIVQLKLETD